MSNQNQFRIKIIFKYKIKSIKICLTSNTVNLYRYMYVCLCFDDLQKKKRKSPVSDSLSKGRMHYDSSLIPLDNLKNVKNRREEIAREENLCGS